MFTPAHGEGGELSLLVTFTSNNTGAKYEQLLSYNDIMGLSMKREDGVVRRIFAIDTELILDIVGDQACIKAVEEHGAYMNVVLMTRLKISTRSYAWEFVIRIERSNENSGEGGESDRESNLVRDIDDLRRHNQTLSKRIDKLEAVISALAIEMFKKENTRKSEEGEIPLAGVQLLATAGVELSQFGFEWLCKIAKAAVRTGNMEICPSIIGAARKFDVNMRRDGGNRETLLHCVIEEVCNSHYWYTGHSVALALVEDLINRGANPRLVCYNSTAVQIMDRCTYHAGGGNPHNVPVIRNMSKIQTLLREAP